MPSNHSRPMSADDIQKAKMRAIHMQDKYGKSNAPASENSPQKNEDLEPPPVSQVPANKVPQLPQPKRNEVKKSPPVPTGKSLSHKPETSASSNPKPNLTTQEQLLEKLKKDQVPWHTPPGTPALFFVRIFSLLYVTCFLYRNKVGVCPQLQRKFTLILSQWASWKDL